MDNNEMNQIPQQEPVQNVQPIQSTPQQEPVQNVQPIQSTPQQEPPVVKESRHIGLKILLVLLVIAVIVLSGLLIYDKFIAKTETKTTSKETTKKDNNIINYAGYYSGCSKDSDGADVCSELVLNEDKTAYLLINPVAAVAVVGTYSIDGNDLIINSTYKLASENGGKDVEKYNLKIDDNTIVYNFDVETINMSFKLTKTTKEKLNLYNQMDKGEIALNQTSNSTNTEYDTVKKLFVNEYLLGEKEKPIDYRIEEIKVLSGAEKQEIVNMGYQSTDILANVKYSIKVNNPSSSAWLAGNGEGGYGNWLFGKSAVVVIRDGKLYSVGTGW